MRIHLALIALTLTAPLMLPACAVAPDPAEVCTAEWIMPRTARAVEDITKNTGSAMKSLRRVGETYAAGRTPGPLQLLSLASAMKSLEREVKNGRGIRDLKTLANTCNDCLLYTSPSPRDRQKSRMPSSA